MDSNATVSLCFRGQWVLLVHTALISVEPFDAPKMTEADSAERSLQVGCSVANVYLGSLHPGSDKLFVDHIKATLGVQLLNIGDSVVTILPHYKSHDRRLMHCKVWN